VGVGGWLDGVCLQHGWKQTDRQAAGSEGMRFARLRSLTLGLRRQRILNGRQRDESFAPTNGTAAQFHCGCHSCADGVSGFVASIEAQFALFAIHRRARMRPAH